MKPLTAAELDEFEASIPDEGGTFMSWEIRRLVAMARKSIEPKRLVAVSARDLVEGLEIDAGLFDWCSTFCDSKGFLWSAPAFAEELATFKDRMRANGYKTNAGPVKDAHAAFRTHMRNAVKFATKKTNGPAKVAAKVDRKEL